MPSGRIGSAEAISPLTLEYSGCRLLRSLFESRRVSGCFFLFVIRSLYGFNDAATSLIHAARRKVVGPGRNGYNPSVHRAGSLPLSCCFSRPRPVSSRSA